MVIDGGMARSDPYAARARELARAAGLDPDARIERPGQRSMPFWCTFRDAARAEHMQRQADAAAADIASKLQPPQFRDSPLQVFGRHDEATLAPASSAPTDISAMRSPWAA
jgi:tRNA-splicing ligase RtcB